MMQKNTRRRRVSFMLTPLIDVIFLLLIFFMLSSQVAPYSLLPLGGVASGDDAPSPAPPEPADPAVLPLVVRVARGQVNVGGETMAIYELRQAAGRFRREGRDAYLVIPSGNANVQDVVSALEALNAASVASVTLLNARRAQP